MNTDGSNQQCLTYDAASYSDYFPDWEIHNEVTDATQPVIKAGINSTIGNNG